MPIGFGDASDVYWHAYFLPTVEAWAQDYAHRLPTYQAPVNDLRVG